MSGISYRKKKTEASVLIPKVFQLVTQIGPNFPQVARKLGKREKEVEQAYGRLADSGLRLEAVPALDRIGLTSSLVRAKFDKSFVQYATAILTAMNELSYVTGFIREIGNRRYFAFHVMIPDEILPEFQLFLEHLRQIRILESFELFTFDKTRYVPTSLRHYDVDKMKWKFRWEEMTESVPVISCPWPEVRETIQFTNIDLLILKEIQLDAIVTPERIAEKLKLDLREVQSHFPRVATPGGLIREYRFVWFGWSPWHHREMSFMYSSHHPTLSYSMLARNPSPEDTKIIRTALNRIPFLRYEAVGRDYFARMAFPPDSLEGILTYLDVACSNVDANLEFFVEDPKTSTSFTIPYHLYDQESNYWKFDRRGLSVRFDDLVEQVTGRSPELHALASELDNLQPGKKTWGPYQDLCRRILDYCLVPPLSAGVKEMSTHAGVQRFDLIYQLPYDAMGIWEHIRRTHASTCLVVECKNYSKPLRQNQIFMTSKYLGPKKAGGSFGIILSRKGPSSSAQKQQLELWKLNDAIILCLSDEDLKGMIDLRQKELKPEELIDRKYREFRQLV